MSKHKEKGEQNLEKQCDCEEKCECEEKSNCNCEEKCDCEETCKCEQNDKADEYLNLARQIQADFENFRRHAIEDLKEARIAGQKSVIEVFLPCLDTFNQAKKSITDQVILDGINMIENGIVDALASLGVEKIESVGQVYNPHLHEAITFLTDNEKENNIILQEFQAGYTFNGKVIRYAKVIVNKKD